MDRYLIIWTLHFLFSLFTEVSINKEINEEMTHRKSISKLCYFVKETCYLWLQSGYRWLHHASSPTAIIAMAFARGCVYVAENMFLGGNSFCAMCANLKAGLESWKQWRTHCSASFSTLRQELHYTRHTYFVLKGCDWRYKDLCDDMFFQTLRCDFIVFSQSRCLRQDSTQHILSVSHQTRCWVEWHYHHYPIYMG